MRNTTLWPSLLGRLWPGVVAPDIYGSNRTQLCIDALTKLLEIEQFLHLTVCK